MTRKRSHLEPRISLSQETERKREDTVMRMMRVTIRRERSQEARVTVEREAQIVMMTMMIRLLETTPEERKISQTEENTLNQMKAMKSLEKRVRAEKMKKMTVIKQRRMIGKRKMIVIVRNQDHREEETRMTQMMMIRLKQKETNKDLSQEEPRRVETEMDLKRERRRLRRVIIVIIEIFSEYRELTLNEKT